MVRRLEWFCWWDELYVEKGRNEREFPVFLLVATVAL